MVRKCLWLALIALATTVFCECASAKEVLYAAMGRLGVKTLDLSGTPLGEFPFGATHIAANSSGDMFVSTAGLQLGYGVRFNSAGVFQNLFIPTTSPGETQFITFGSTVDAHGDFCLSVSSTAGERIEKFDAGGTSKEVFAVPFANAMAFDAFGNMYTSNGQRISPDGTAQWIFRGNYYDIGLDSLNNVYITNADYNRSTITKRGPDGQLIQTIDPMMTQAYSVAFDSNDVMYVGGSIGNQPAIRRFRLDGTPLGDFIVFPPAGYDVVLDIAIVDVIPEPMTVALLALGSPVVFASMCRRLRRWSCCW